VCATPLWAQAQDKAKATVEATCNTCHPLSARVGSGYDAKGWHTVMRMMVNHGAPVPKDQMEAMTQFLIKTYPVDTGRRAKASLISGPVKVTMKIWPAATPGSRPHDPLAARDGSLWYTGQMANVLGRVDPKTGKVRDHTSRHLSDGVIDLSIMQYDASTQSAESKASGEGPCIHHFAVEVDDLASAEKEIRSYGCEIISDPGVIPVKFRAPGGTVCEIVPRHRYKKKARKKK
jgi:hypothetical protein